MYEYGGAKENDKDNSDSKCDEMDLIKDINIESTKENVTRWLQLQADTDNEREGVPKQREIFFRTSNRLCFFT